MKLLVEKSLTNELSHHFLTNNIDLKEIRSIGFDPSSIDSGVFIQYLTVGGGLVAIAKVLVSYLQIRYQKRSIKVTTNEGDVVEIEAASVDEISELLAKAQNITVTQKSIGEEE